MTNQLQLPPQLQPTQPVHFLHVCLTCFSSAAAFAPCTYQKTLIKATALKHFSAVVVCTSFS